MGTIPYKFCEIPIYYTKLVKTYMKAVYGYDLPKGLKAVRTPNLEHSCILVIANIL